MSTDDYLSNLMYFIMNIDDFKEFDKEGLLDTFREALVRVAHDPTESLEEKIEPEYEYYVDYGAGPIGVHSITNPDQYHVRDDGVLIPKQKVSEK